MTDDEAWAFLESQKVGVLGSVGPNGDPHLVNVAYLIDDEQNVLISSFRASQKIKNLKRNGRASFLVEVTWPYNCIKGVMMSGPAVIVDDYDTVVKLTTTMKEKHAEMSGTSEGTPEIDVEKHAAKRVVVRLEPEKLRSWDHTKLGGTY